MSDSCKNNSKKFLAYVKSKGQEFIGVTSSKNKEGFLQSDTKVNANILTDSSNQSSLVKIVVPFPIKDHAQRQICQIARLTGRADASYKNLKKGTREGGGWGAGGGWEGVKRKVQGVPQSQTTALPRHQEEEETDKTKTSANRTNVRKAPRLALSSTSEVIAMLK